MPLDDDGGVPATAASSPPKQEKADKPKRKPAKKAPPRKAASKPKVKAAAKVKAPKAKAEKKPKTKPAAKKTRKPKAVAKGSKAPKRVAAPRKAKQVPRGAAKARTPSARRAARAASMAAPVGPPKIIQTADFVALRELQEFVRKGCLEAEKELERMLKRQAPEVQARARELTTDLGLSPRGAGLLAIRLALAEEKLRAFSDYELVETDDGVPPPAVRNGSASQAEATS